MSNVSKGKEFEKDCIVFLNSLFDKVEWLSEEKKSVFDFKCYKEDREYFIEAKYNRSNIKPTLRKSQKSADFVITNNGEDFILIPKNEFSEKIRVSKEDAILIKVSVATKTSLDLFKIHPRQSYDEVIVKLILERKANE